VAQQAINTTSVLHICLNVLLIVSKVELAYFVAPALCHEYFAVITLKSISSPLTFYTDKTHKE